MSLEEMGSFFNKRVDDYESHMKTYVPGANDYYRVLAEQLPKDKEINLIDLGCGTGLELDEIFLLNPNVQVTGIDLASDMLAKLSEKHAERMDRIRLICGSYFDYDYEQEHYDYAISVQTMHHFTHETKVGLYKKLYKSLKEDGCYIETDYMTDDQAFEDFHFSEYERLSAEAGNNEAFYHYDTPCTVENQKKMLLQAGFRKVELVWREANTVMLKAYK